MGDRGEHVVIQLVTLGRTEVRRDGRFVPVPADGCGFLLLVYLAVEGPQSSEYVARLLWPDLDLDQAHRELRSTARQLRELLGADVVEVDGDQVGMGSVPIESDVGTLRRADSPEELWQARSLYGGPFLAGVDVSGYEGAGGEDGQFARWVEGVRNAAEARMREASERAGMRWAMGDDLWSRLVRAVRSRRTVHAALLYLGFSWGSLEVCNVLVEREILPDPVFRALLMILAVGLPLVVGWVWILEKRKSASLASGNLADIRFKATHLVAVLAVLAVASGVAWTALYWEGEDPISAAWAGLPPEKHIAVLPFEAMEGDSLSQRFADGLMEVVTHTLGGFEGLQGTLWVVPSMEILGHGVRTVSEARSAFDVNLAVTGNVRYVGDSARVSVSLVDAARLRQIDTFEFSEPLANVDRIEARLANGLRDLLRLELGPGDEATLASGGTEDPRAYELFVQGQGYLVRHEREANLEEAIARFQKALEYDSEYVRALAGLAEAHLLKHLVGRDAAELERAREAVERALELDDQVAGVQRTTGMIHSATGRYEAALEAYGRALEIEPHSAEAHQGRAQALEALGRIGEAEAEFLRAVELRPGFWGGHNALGAFYRRRGRFGEALEQFLKVVELTPDNGRGWANLGAAYADLGRFPDALEALERANEIAPTFHGFSNLGTVAYFLERYDQAAAAFERALELDDRQFEVWRNLGSSYDALPGHEEEARQAYEEARELGRAAVELNPHDAQAIIDLASVHERLGEPDRARALVRQAAELAPDNVQILYQAADIHLKLGDRDRAIHWAVEALSRGYPWEALAASPDVSSLLDDPRLQELAPEGGASDPDADRPDPQESHNP